MSDRSQPRIALLFSQFAAYHVDRCEAVAARLSGRCKVIAIEVATGSKTYAWPPSGSVAGADKITLFPDAEYEAISRWRRFAAQFRVLRRCRTVFIGIGYNEPDIIALSWLLPLCGVKVVMMTDSKFDDSPRRVGFEFAKAALLLPYRAAIVAGRRQRDYVRFLGFRRRPVLPGYDTVGVARLQALGTDEEIAHGQRAFAFVGRFVAKKNLAGLILGYGEYCRSAGPAAHRLVLVGSGPDEPALRALIAAQGLADRIDLLGFLDASASAKTMSRALALVLPSAIEQWGLVVNEALAFGLPVIVSTQVGARDVLVRNLINGFIVEPGSTAGLAQAMAALAGDPALWQRMAQASRDRAWFADSERFADAVELLIDPAAQPAGEHVAAFHSALDCPFAGLNDSAENRV